MKLSVVIPAHNEDTCIVATVEDLSKKLRQSSVQHEILVVNDNSSDKTEELLKQLTVSIPGFRYVNNSPPHGFGAAIRCGLDQFTGDAVAIYMADASDNPEDLIYFFQTLEKDRLDCVFGTRFHPDAKIYDYPFLKLMINRMAKEF